jgi:hypothetical protein
VSKYKGASQNSKSVDNLANENDCTSAIQAVTPHESHFRGQYQNFAMDLTEIPQVTPLQPEGDIRAAKNSLRPL